MTQRKSTCHEQMDSEQLQFSFTRHHLSFFNCNLTEMKEHFRNFGKTYAPQQRPRHKNNSKLKSVTSHLF